MVWSDDTWAGGAQGHVEGRWWDGARVIRSGDPRHGGHWWTVWFPRSGQDVRLAERFSSLEAAKAAAEVWLLAHPRDEPTPPRRREPTRRVANRPEPARWPKGARRRR
jgi:hypothetical protein